MSLISEQTEPDEAKHLTPFSDPFHILRCLTGCWRCQHRCKVTAITSMYQSTGEELGWDPDDTETVCDYDYSNHVPTEPSELSSIRSLTDERLAPPFKLNPDFALADGGYQTSAGVEPGSGNTSCSARRKALSSQERRIISGILKFTLWMPRERSRSTRIQVQD
jgi:hypothetical protein